MPKEDAFTVVIELDEAVTSETVDARVAEEAEARRDDGAMPAVLDPLSWALIIGSVAALAAVIWDIYERSKGGMVIDRTQTPAQCRRDSGVLPGTIVVLLADGTVEIKTTDIPDSAAKKILSEILKLTVGATAEQVKKIAEAAGGSAEIDG